LGRTLLRKKVAIVVYAVFSIVGSVRADAKAARLPSRRAAGSRQQAAGDPDQFKQDFINSTKQYQTSLQALALSYSQQLDSLTARNATMRDLFGKGLVSRVEMDRSETAVAETRAKIDGLQQEAKSVDAALTAAMTPSAGAGYPSVIGTSATWTTGDKKIDELIRRYGSRYNVDPYLIYLVMHQESGFSSSALSAKGAQGLMQLMPETAARYGVTNRLDPAQSIMGGAHYLSDLLRLFNGNVSLALAGYNAGEGAVMRYGNRVPPYQETRYYVRDISAHYKAKP
jgi:soluble lytic murein transglycosylase-like protein